MFLSESLVHCFRDPPNDDLGWDLAGDRQKGDSSPVIAITQGSFFRDLYKDTLCPVFR